MPNSSSARSKCQRASEEPVRATYAWGGGPNRSVLKARWWWMSISSRYACETALTKPKWPCCEVVRRIMLGMLSEIGTPAVGARVPIILRLRILKPIASRLRIVGTSLLQIARLLSLLLHLSVIVSLALALQSCLLMRLVVLWILRARNVPHVLWHACWVPLAWVSGDLFTGSESAIRLPPSPTPRCSHAQMLMTRASRLSTPVRLSVTRLRSIARLWKAHSAVTYQMTRLAASRAGQMTSTLIRGVPSLVASPTARAQRIVMIASALSAVVVRCIGSSMSCLPKFLLLFLIALIAAVERCECRSAQSKELLKR